METPISTEYAVELPIGYRSPEGQLHRSGTMRLATAGDEINAMRDPLVRADPNCLIHVLLARTLKLDGIATMSASVIQEFFLRDFAHVHKVFNEINGMDDEPEPIESAPGVGGLSGNVDALPD